MSSETAQSIGTRIGEAIARDTLADRLPQEWVGLEPQDSDQIPEGVNRGDVEAAAEAAYREAINLHPLT